MKPQAAVGSNDRHPSDKRSRQRTPRRTHSSPISFGQILHNTRRDRHTNGESIDLAVGVPAAGLMLHGSVIEQRTHEARAAISGTDAHRTAQVYQSDSQQSRQVSPERAMQLIADVTREMNGATGARELHLELEPAHLGPIVASIMIQRGSVSVRITAREHAAARRLDADTDTLRSRLVALGYSDPQVDVAHDQELALTAT